MKKIYLSCVFLALFLVSCQANKPSSPSSSQITQKTTDVLLYTTNQSSDGETTTMIGSHSNTESALTIIWVEEGEMPIYDETGLRTIGIKFREADLSEPISWANATWDELGLTIEPRSDLAQILGHSITTRDEAAKVAYEILKSEQEVEAIFGGSELELMKVEHDPDKNIWIFAYWENNVNVGSNSFYVAIEGKSGKLLRMWIV